MIDWVPEDDTVPDYDGNAPCFRYDIADFDDGNMPWFISTESDYTWYNTDEDQWSGSYSMVSEDIVDNQECHAIINIENLGLPKDDGHIYFFTKCSSEVGWDYMYVLVDDGFATWTDW